MKLLFKLILREAWYHRSRISLAVLAAMAMSCMVVWLIGSIDIMMLQFDQDGERYLGHYHLTVMTGDSNVIDNLRNNHFVAQIDGACQIRNIMAKKTDEESALRRQRAGLGIPIQSPAVIGIEAHDSPFDLEEGRWFADGLEGVMGTAAAASLKVNVGNTVNCRIGTAEFDITVVGLIEQKLSSGGMGQGLSPAVGALFVSMETAKQMQPKRQNDADYFYVRLKDGTNVQQFKKNCEKHFSEQKLTVAMIDADDIQQGLDKTRRDNPAAGLMGGAASLNSIIIFSTLVSILIVFTALSMGISERSRVFAMLRAIGMSRCGIAGLIFGESVILSLFGWIGGMIAGWFVLQLTVWSQPQIFGIGKTIALPMSAVTTAGIAAFAGSLLAAIIPSWRAAMIPPVEGMNRGYIMDSVFLSQKAFCLFCVTAVPLLSVAPIIAYYEPLTDNALFRQLLYTYLGLPTLILGLIFLVPPIILFVEKIGTPIIAFLFRIRKELLVRQLSSHFWRTLGTTMALSVGLGIYCFLEISGYSMLVPYIHSKTIPDTIVTVLPKGLPLSAIPAVRQTAGVDPNRFLPIALEQPAFSERQTKRFLEEGLNPMQVSAVVFGLDIEEAFGKRKDGSRPMVEVSFIEGTLESALSKLRTGGRYCLVPDSFAFRTKVHVGDKLELVKPREDRQFGGGRRGRGGSPPEGLGDAANRPPEVSMDYEVCGVISMPGWLWMTKISGVRKRGQRSGALLLAPYETVQNDFQLKDAGYFWFDRIDNVSDTDLENALQRIAETESEENVAQGRPMVKVSSHDYLNGSVGRRADQVIQMAAKMPLILLAISSIGMMGTIAASIRTRRFELGVLRCLGVTRFGLVRLILGEAVLISGTAILVSFCFGAVGAWSFVGLMRYVSVFGGFVSPLVIPVYYILTGMLIALVFCLLAAAIPAITAGRTEPAMLLRE